MIGGMDGVKGGGKGREKKREGLRRTDGQKQRGARRGGGSREKIHLYRNGAQGISILHK